jgi:hypothetical protein
MRVGLSWARSFGTSKLNDGKLTDGGPSAGGPSSGRAAAGDGWLGPLRLTASESRRVLTTLGSVAAGLAVLALGDLAVRSALRLNLRWDTFAYHLPYAALHGGLPIPYEMNDLVRPAFDAYPVLPELVQGVLWRLTGSMNATGVVNYIALAMFLAYARLALGAPLGLVALGALTAPLVIIHASSSYVDLFGNAFLAIGLCSCLALYLAPERARRAIVWGAPLALAAAAWSKYLLAPIAGVAFALFAALSLRTSPIAGLSRSRVASYLGLIGLLAAAPYLKNLIVFGNPFWPLRLPLIGDWFPYTNDALRGAIRERPPVMRSTSQLELFLRSLFEIDQPTSYPNRLRWIIDQGSTVEGFRMGGFWGVAAVVYAIVVPCMLVICHGKRGWAASAMVLGTLALAGCLPQSHELRYYLFIPLTGAGCVGLLFRRLESAAPHAAMGLLTVVLGLFIHMGLENLPHYAIDRVDHVDAARAWRAAEWWPKLRGGETYCAVDMMPIGILLTGPTLSQYTIVDRSRPELCPTGSRIIQNGVISP